MGVIIESAKFDYLWPQFYNNNNYSARCALPVNGNAPFNYDCRVSYTASTPSANASTYSSLSDPFQFLSDLCVVPTLSNETKYLLV